jgi:acyl-CoA reductase-like NAD-dependent aldehyde dehydrogenase
LTVIPKAVSGAKSAQWLRALDAGIQPKFNVWNCSKLWRPCRGGVPAHAAFGGYKQSGIGRETHKMMLDHYQQTKNVLVSYSPKALGFF